MYIIAGSATGGILLIVVLLILVICTIVLCKNNQRLKKDSPPQRVLDLKKFQTEQIREVANQLTNKGKNPEKVINAVGKMIVKINNSRVRADEAGEEDELQDEENELQNEEDELQDEQDKMQKILSDYVDYMKEQLTEELTKEHQKLNE